MPRDTTYFAAELEPDDFGERFAAKITEYREASAVKDVFLRLSRAYNYHFGTDASGVHLTSGVTRSGEVGELAEVRINHLRANSLTTLNLVVGPKISWTPVATNGDSASTKQAYNATSLLDYYWLSCNVSAYAVQAVAHAIPLTEGFVFTPWDDSLGETVAVDEMGAPIPAGDFAFYNPLAFDVMRDPSKRSWEEGRWVAVCLWQNRYELAAKFPEKEGEILDAPSGEKESDRTDSFGECDDIPVWYFFHKRSPIPTLKNGLEAVVLEDGTVLRHGQLTYDQIPLHRVVPDEYFGTPFGYSQYHEAMGIQEATDSLSSAILTNQDAFARQMVAVEAGQPFSPEDIGGMKVFYYHTKKPEALQLTSSPAEAFRFVDSLKKDMQRIQGVNDAVQGQLPGDAKLSGAALALLSSQALQQNSTLQASYVQMVRSIGNCILNEWKKRTPEPRKIKLVGRGNEFLCREQEMSGSDLEQIKEVLVDIGSPMTQTHAGKVEMAQMLLTIPGAITSPEQIQQIMATGNMDNLSKGTRDELILILEENEKIADGVPSSAMISDDHLRHGREHRSAMASTAARENPAAVAAFTQHMHEHYKLFFGWPDPNMPVQAPAVGIDPATGAPIPDPNFDPTSPVNDPMYRERMLILVGQQPPPPMMPPGMGMPPMDPGGAPPPPPPGKAPDGSNLEKPPELAGNPTALPSMPKNPATGEKFTTPNGQGTVPQ